MLKAHVLNDQICAHSNNAAHSIEVPAGARLLFCNGQVGAHKDGTVPKDPTEQIEVIFERIRTILVAAHMAWHDIVKLTVYVTDKAIISDFLEARARHLGDHKKGGSKKKLVHVLDCFEANVSQPLPLLKTP